MIDDPTLTVVAVEDKHVVTRDVVERSIVFADADAKTVSTRDSVDRSIVFAEVESNQIVSRDTVERSTVFSGEQGPPGPPGPTGPTYGPVEINFSFGDATPVAVATVLANQLIYGVQLHIRVPFDGVGAALVVGDPAQPDRLMKANENDVLTVGTSTTAPAHAYAAATSVRLSITPGAGATQGAGVLVLGIKQ